MKLQIGGQRLRLRIDEDELRQLLDGGSVGSSTRLGAGLVFAASLQLHDGARPGLHADAAHWRLRLPRAALLDYVARLPCREGCDFSLAVDDGDPLRVSVEVDVRDSIRTRGAKRRGAQAP